MKDYRETLQHNIEYAVKIDPDQYPSLAAYFHTTSARKTYIALNETALSYDKPLYKSQKGKAFFAIAQSFLISKYGGACHVWQSTLIMLQISGLIERIIPSRHSTTRAFQQIYQTAKRRKRKPEAVYFIPQLTDAILTHSDAVLTRWKRSGVSFSHISKASVIKALGEEYADALYLDGRTEPNRKREIREAMTYYIYSAVKSSGYTTKEKTLHYLRNEYPDDWLTLLDVWQRVHGAIILDCGCRYSRPTAREKKDFNLSSDEWIIREMVNNDDCRANEKEF